MDKKKHNPNEITDSTLHQLLLDINARLEHIEDMEADNRALIVKVVKQGNSIVDFLKNVEIEDINDTYDNYPNFNLNEPTKLSQNVQDHQIYYLLFWYLDPNHRPNGYLTPSVKQYPIQNH